MLRAVSAQDMRNESGIPPVLEKASTGEASVKDYDITPDGTTRKNKVLLGASGSEQLTLPG